MAGDKKIPGGWERETGIILNLEEHPGVNAPDRKRLIIGSQKAGDRLVTWLQEHGYGLPDE